jgi:hypothetical protein
VQREDCSLCQDKQESAFGAESVTEKPHTVARIGADRLYRATRRAVKHLVDRLINKLTRIEATAAIAALGNALLCLRFSVVL